MEEKPARRSIWIVQGSENESCDGRIVALCASVEEAEAFCEEHAEFFEVLEYADFPLDYRFGG